MLAAAIAQEEIPESKIRLGALAVGILLFGGLTLLAIALLLLLRIRTYRKNIATRLGLGEGPVAGASGHRVDPWAESARRLEIEPRADADDDTVDFDPDDLGPDDIEPNDEPPPLFPGEGGPEARNGKGPH
jgi:hypothetical protein